MDGLTGLISEWFLAVAGLACLGGGFYAVWRFAQKPTAEQIEAVKEWLLWAVTNAERELGSGTGRLKLRQVYDRFLQRFPVLSRLVPFDAFSGYVDEALEQMRNLLATNKAVREYVERDGATAEAGGYNPETGYVHEGGN